MLKKTALAAALLVGISGVAMAQSTTSTTKDNATGSSTTTTNDQGSGSSMTTTDNPQKGTTTTTTKCDSPRASESDANKSGANYSMNDCK